MALTKTGTDGIKDDAVTSAKLATGAVTSAKIADLSITTNDIADAQITQAKIGNSAIVAAKIADTAVTLAKLEHGTSSNDGKFLRANNGADPSFETVSIPAGVGGANGVDFNDDIKTRYGNSNDLEIWHSSNSNTYIKNNTGELKLASDNIALMTTDQSEKFIDCNGNGNVELYHDNTKQCETSSVGLKFPSGKGIDFSATGDGSSSMSSELFDDYEEGGWTPASNTGTVSVADNGKYVKIGRMVYLSVLLYNFSDTSTSTSVLITGVPYAASGQHVGTVWLRRTTSGGKGWVCTLGDSGATTINIQRHSDGNDMGAALQHSNFAHSTPYMNLSITYQTA